jgi:hypothetical protein
MKRRYCLVFGVVLLASCSSTDAPSPAGAGASATAGAGSGGRPAGGSSGASSPGGSAGAPSGGAGNASGSAGISGAGSSAGGASGASSGAGGASGASSGAGGASGASGTAGASGAAGSAGAGGNGGSAGSAGAPAKYCDSHALVPAPVIVTEAFEVDQVGKDLNLQLSEYDFPAVCDEAAVMDGVGSCTEWEYKPETGGGTIKWQWVSDPAGIKYAPVCMAAGMTKVTFAARGKLGGEIVTFGASQATPVDITLTAEWKQYSISLANVKYNSDSQGVQPAFFWSLDASKNPGKLSVRFAAGDIQYVNN